MKPLSDAALFAPAQAKVLSWLFGHPERSFHHNELLRATGLASASLVRELHRLDRAGLVTRTLQGNQVLRQANPNHPIYAELCSIVRKTLGAPAALAQALSPLRERVTLALIYGSMAKGSSHASSDVDLMLVGEPLSLREVYALLEPAQQALGRTVNPTVFNPAEFNVRLADPDSFVSRVLAQPVDVLWGSLDRATNPKNQEPVSATP